ncbi:MAG: MFS transporter [Clostridia bacterium]|nr:MAG: MFS transporter [Clostridia bacterium]
MYRLALPLIYLTGGVYNIALFVAVILIPLYALSLGLDPMSIAVLVSVPAAMQLVTRFIGGAMTDRWGEKNVLLVSYGGIALTGLAFAGARGFWAMMAAQFLLSFSRGLFWSPAQTYLSKLPGSKVRLGQIMGYFNGTTSAGAVAGLMVGGMLPERVGYSLSFLGVAALGVTCLVFLFFLPSLPKKGAGAVRGTGFGGLLEVAKIKPLYLAGICAFVAALPMSLVGSFYPIYLDDVGFSEDVIGILTALRSVGMVIAGVFLGKYVDLLSPVLSYSLGLVAAGAGLALTRFTADGLALALLISLTGTGAGVANTLYQTLTARYSPEDKRGAAMALTGNFWGASLLVTPLVFGLITELISLASSFLIVGMAVIITGALGPVMFKWLLPAAYLQPQPALESPGRVKGE